MRTRTTILLAILGLGVQPARANTPPLLPTITEPALDGQTVNPADVHMETAPFGDPDAGDMHLCTTWEIWTVVPAELVWAANCIGGLERVHTHLGDGIFTGSHVGRKELMFDRDYSLQVRHRDSSGQPGTEWSPWAQRPFRTGPPSTVFPLEMEDIANTPEPQWLDELGDPIILPIAVEPPWMRMESPAGDLLLEMRGQSAVANLVTNPPPLAGHVNARVRVSAGGVAGGLPLPASRLLFTDGHGTDLVAYLPPIGLAPGEEAYYWISANGSTFIGLTGQTQPDFSTLARGAPVPWAVRQPGFQVEVMASGFQLPVNIAFVPSPGPLPESPLYYVTELYGTIKVVTRGGAVYDYATGLLNFNPTGNFPGSGEQGLTGIVVEPVTGDVMVSLLYDSAVNPGIHYPKVIRFHSTDGGLSAAGVTTMLDMPGESQGQSHQISNLSIGPDGRLYVHMGDGFSSATAQNLNSFRGKILRLNLDGTPAPDNPFYDPADGITARDYVFAYGLRNPFGGAWRAADGAHYEVENGPSVDRLAQIVAGRNYLWNGSDASMANYAIYLWNPATAPVNIAFVQPSTFAGSGFPIEKMDHAFVAESGPTYATGPVSNGKRISEFVLDAAGNRLSGPTPLIEYTGAGKATVVALAAGPDGLYFSDFYKDVDYTSPIERGANILRVRFTGSADFTAEATTGQSPLSVRFSDRSNVPGAATWLWHFGDGQTSTAQNPTHVYSQDGIYDVRLRVTGAAGASVVQKPAFVRVGVYPNVAFIGGSPAAAAADAAVADHLRATGYTVDYFDDDRSNRPSAANLAENYDLVVVSSTIASTNVGGDFRDRDVPLLYWEQALNRVDREPLASNGVALDGATHLNIAPAAHPILAAVPAGRLQLFTSATRLSVALDSIGSGVTVLATHDGHPEQAAILAAEQGAALLSGRTAPARRVFFCIEDSSWLSTTELGRRLLRQSVDWCLNRAPKTVRPDFDGDLDVDQSDFGHFQVCLSGPGVVQSDPECLNARLDADGDVDLSDFGIFQRCLSGEGIVAPSGCDQSNWPLSP